MSDIYIGIDLSTQALKVLALNDSLDLIGEICVNYSADLPHYGTTEGFLKENDTVTSPVKMWVEALDLAFERLSHSIDLKRVSGISGCAQQHGTVYVKNGFLSLLNSLMPHLSLIDQIGSSFSIPCSPIWMDSSTSEYCKNMEKVYRGPHILSQHTGSRAHARFSAHQIQKILHERPEEYHSTERIMLVSNFISTLLVGEYMPIDLSDGSGMNLLHIFNKKWVRELCTLYDDIDISEKIGMPVPTIQMSYQKKPTISKYFIERHGFNPQCQIGNFTGDNPATLVGMFLNSDDMILSLGTSDVLISVAENVKPSPDIHVFCNPLNSDNHMFIICYKNGSLVREKLKDEYCSGSWDVFNSILNDSLIDPDLIGNYFLQPEICPEGLIGPMLSKSDIDLLSLPPSNIIRTVIEGQFLSKACDVDNAGFVPSNKSRLIVVGGGSVNATILSIISDIFGMDVYRADNSNIAALGGAYLAYIAVNGMDALEHAIRSKTSTLNLICRPDEQKHKLYCEMKKRYTLLQNQTLDKNSKS